MSARVSDYKDICIVTDLTENEKRFSAIFQNDATIRFKHIRVRGVQEYDCAVFYLDGMVNQELVNDSVVRPLLTVRTQRREDSLAGFVAAQVLFASEVKQKRDVAELLRAILYGDTVLFIDGCPDALIINTKGWEKRSITEPEDERVLQGPREGFSETAMSNLSLLRRKLLTTDLCIEMHRVGGRTETQVYICYLDSLVNKRALTLLRKRLSGIDMDGVLDANYIAEQIRDHKHSLFKTTGCTERPDIVAARLLEGRVALIVDGTPVVLTVPYLFSENFQSDEDYYLNALITSFNRLLRYICFFLSIAVPGLFIGAVTFHKELLPTTLAITVSKLRSGIPFPIFGECLILLLVFEILKESGVRMPQSLGHALSIVGGLVVGEAAVNAKVISAPVLIVVALSGISGLVVPRAKEAVVYLRVMLVIASALFGLYGFLALLIGMFLHILSLDSFGVSYTVSLKRADFQSLKDTLIRAPWTRMIKRPEISRDRVRMKERNG